MFQSDTGSHGKVVHLKRGVSGLLNPGLDLALGDGTSGTEDDICKLLETIN